MNEEFKRSDNPMSTGVVFIDKEGKLHFYNPAISLEEFNAKELST